MDSLISYESDNDDFTEDVMPMPSEPVRNDAEQDANYDVVGMDESDEDTNNNETILVSYQDDGFHEDGTIYEPPLSLADAPLDFRPHKYRHDMNRSSLDRRQSIDMEMDEDSSSEEKPDSDEQEYTDDELSGYEKESMNEQSTHYSTEYLREGSVVQNSDLAIGTEQTTDDDKQMNIQESSPQDPGRTEEGKNYEEDESNCPRQTSSQRDSSPSRYGGSLKRSHSPERSNRDRSSHYRGSSRSPERTWKHRRFDRKCQGGARSDSSFKSAREMYGEQLKTQVQQVEAKTGIVLPSYYNPAVMNPLKYAQQIQKRKLLWGNKSNETNAKDVGMTATTWNATTFKGDNDGKMTEKFKRLMGIKTETAGNSSAPVQGESKVLIQKQEEMFSNMEAQYQVARMVTHTHRGVGLGYGTYQTRPSLQKNS